MHYIDRHHMALYLVGPALTALLIMALQLSGMVATDHQVMSDRAFGSQRIHQVM